MFTEKDLAIIQGTDARGYIAFLTSVWNSYPNLKLDEVSDKAIRLWEARKEWVKCLEPTPRTLESEQVVEIECSACKSDNTLIQDHMNVGGCLYVIAVEIGLIQPSEPNRYPPLPPSPPPEVGD